MKSHRSLSTVSGGGIAQEHIQTVNIDIKVVDAEERGLSNSSIVLLSCFISWYSINVVYNVSNKHTLQLVKLPNLLALFQLLVGIPYVIFLWVTGIRVCPTVSLRDIYCLVPIAFFHTLTHAAAVNAFAFGSVHFAHIVKTAEPCTTSIIAFLILGERHHWQVYSTLLIVVGGIAITCVKSMEFSITVFLFAMLSNIGSSMRGTLSKKVMEHTTIGKDLSASNLYGVLTIMSFVMYLPFVLILELTKINAIWNNAMNSNTSSATLLFIATLSGATYYAYNEVSFITLSKVSPVTHAVANTFKRVLIIIITAYWFSNGMSKLAWIGGGIAVVGVLMYSLAKVQLKTKNVCT